MIHGALSERPAELSKGSICINYAQSLAKCAFVFKILRTEYALKDMNTSLLFCSLAVSSKMQSFLLPLLQNFCINCISPYCKQRRLYISRGWSRDVKVTCILTSPGRPTDIGLQLGKACYHCSR